MLLKNHYEAPRADVIGLDAACTLMQGSMDVPASGNAIPDVEIVPIDWNLLQL